MSRRPIVAANWKMNLDREAAVLWSRGLVELVSGHYPAAEILVFPSFPWLVSVAEPLDTIGVARGGQDLHTEEKGAHTGDVSGPQLVSAGCTWALCGHSERRHGHGEADELVGRKALRARACGLRPLICLGETGPEREAERTLEVLGRQLRAAVPAELDTFDLAYEPVWAIGTGATATPEMAQETQAGLRRLLADLRGAETSDATRILYGGSVKPANAAELLRGEDVDGFLVGGASLDPGSFWDIIAVCGESASSSAPPQSR